MNIISKISEWRKNRDDKKKAEKTQEFYSRTKSIFQITEYNKEMWFTFNGKLVCPCTYFKDDAITALEELRRLYFVNYFKDEQ